MNTQRAKRHAEKQGCEFWYDRRSHVWVLRRKGVVSVEATGGSFMSSGQVYTITPEVFHSRFILPALNGEKEQGK